MSIIDILIKNYFKFKIQINIIDCYKLIKDFDYE